MRRPPVLASPPALALGVALGLALGLAPPIAASADARRRAWDLPQAPGHRAAEGARAAQAGAPGALPDPAAPRGSVTSVLRVLRDTGAIDPTRHDLWRREWADSRRTLRRLRGTRRAQLYAVRANVAALAEGGLLNAARAPLAFLTLERNRAWWAAGPLLAAGRRVEFPGSELVWQMYPGQGLQVQWLGTFGKANGLYGARSYDRLRALLDEALALAVPRAGGIAFEYQFRFGGGLPPWASGMAQATAVQALSRAAWRLKAPAYFDAARAALGIFRADPPDGVRVPTAAGAQYLIYSFAPGLRVLNAFAQTLNGLHDFAVLSSDPEGRALFDAGDAELRATLGGWDTGAWSLYSLGGRESDLGYHRLARDFLDGLCDRLEKDGAHGRSFPDPGPYCAAAGRFTDYLVEPPALRVPDATPRKGRRTRVRFSVSKISTVTVTMRRRGRVAYRATLRVGRGSHYVTIVPQRRGPLEVDVRAVDLAGNAASADGTLRVGPAPKRRG